MDQDRLVVVSIACPDEASAREMGAVLVGERLAACAQCHAIHSTYRWKGGVETAGEFMLTVKTMRSKLDNLEAAVRTRHPYEVPEIVATEVVWASAAYAAWVRDSVE